MSLIFPAGHAQSVAVVRGYIADIERRRQESLRDMERMPSLKLAKRPRAQRPPPARVGRSDVSFEGILREVAASKERAR